MNWFGSENEREAPLMSQDTADVQPSMAEPSLSGEAREAELAPEPEPEAPSVKTEVVLGASIPLGRSNTGELRMVVPPHLRNLIPVSPPPNNGEQYQNEVASTQERSMSTAVVSAISMSTAGGKEIVPTEAEEAAVLPDEITAGKAPHVMEEDLSPFEKVVGRIRGIWTKLQEGRISREELGNEFALMTGDMTGGEMNGEMTPKESETKIPRARRARNRELLMEENNTKVGFSRYMPPEWSRKGLMIAGACLVFFLFCRSVRHTKAAGHLYDFSDNHSPFINWNREFSVAFIGNSYMYVNDIPRLVEQVGYPQITQDSCLSAAASLSKLLAAGNGMYEYWQTNASIVNMGYEQQDWVEDEDYVHYDYGSCTIFQLLEGYDGDLAYKNYNGAYLNTGLNPCFSDKYYLTIQQDIHYKNPTFWDYVVINDQTQRMADADDREDSLDALKYAYAPMIKEARVTPLLVDTHATPKYNRTAWDSLAEFQANIYVGATEYMKALQYNLPSTLAPKLVPIGMTYLAIHDDDEEMWEKLFLSDMSFASAHGSYLFATVLYTVIAGHLPHAPKSNAQIEALFETSRTPVYPEYPTVKECNYLRMMAREVVLEGYVPSSFKKALRQVQPDGYDEYEVDENECGENGENCQQEVECEEGEDCQQQEEAEDEPEE